MNPPEQDTGMEEACASDATNTEMHGEDVQADPVTDSVESTSGTLSGSQYGDSSNVLSNISSDRPVLPMAENLCPSLIEHHSSTVVSTLRPLVLAGGGKRRRLNGKQNVFQEVPDEVAAINLRRLNVEVVYDNLKSDKKNVAQNHVRIHLCRQGKRVRDGQSVALRHGVTLQCSSAREYDDNKEYVRKHLLYDLAHTCGLPEGVAGWAAKRWYLEVGDARKRRLLLHESGDPLQTKFWCLKSAVGFITWHGDFGVSELRQLPPATYTVHLVEKWCRRQPCIVSAWDACVNKLLSISDRYKLQGLAFAMEVCTRTWKNEHSLKLHMHAWVLQHRCKQRLSQMEFALPHAFVPFVSGQLGRDGRGIAAYSGCYYVCCAKIGQVFSHTTKEPHTDFAVKPEWIMRMYAADKITIDTARDDLIRQVTRAKDYIQQLEYNEQYRRNRDEELERAKVLAAVMEGAKPPRFPAGVRKWEKQWQDRVVRDRYLFLVLESPTRMGKTRFVQSALVDSPEQALILDCADAVVPALKGNYVRSKHPLIMFDEAHASMVIRCKKLFQASMNPVTYGSSPTNQFVHTVWLHGVKLVIGSNCWKEEVSKLEESEREWIDNNSVYVYVDSPLWVK